MEFKKLAGIALLIVGAMVLLMGSAVTLNWSGHILPSQNIVIGGLVGGIVLLGAGAYLYFGRKKFPI